MGVEGRKVRDFEEAGELLAAWEASDERMSVWCGSRGINWYSLSAYRSWMTRRRAAFVEVESAAPRPFVLAASYRIEVHGAVVEVDDDFDDATLVRLLRAVAAC